MPRMKLCTVWTGSSVVISLMGMRSGLTGLPVLTRTGNAVGSGVSSADRNWILDRVGGEGGR